jgi:hypothetical protein
MIPGDMVEISLIIKQNFVLGFSFQGLLKWFEVTTNAILTRIHCNYAWASLQNLWLS